MSLLEDYMDGLENQQKVITDFLHDWLCTNYGLEAKHRFKIPFYYQNTWICYLNPIKKDGIEFNFVRARELSSYPDLLDFKKRVMVAGISLYKVDEIPLIGLAAVVEEAICLDNTTPYTFQKKKKNKAT